MMDAADDRVILSREEFSRLTDQIGALTEQINQLQGNHQDLIGSVSALQVSYEEGHHNLSSGIPSSAFRSINASSEESSSSTERSEEHTSELQSLMRISYAVFCLKKKTTDTRQYKKQNLLRT